MFLVETELEQFHGTANALIRQDRIYPAACAPFVVDVHRRGFILGFAFFSV